MERCLIQSKISIMRLKVTREISVSAIEIIEMASQKIYSAKRDYCKEFD